MSSRAVLCVTLLAVALPLRALDWGDFALASDRSEDGLLLDVMNGSDLATAAGICSGVGMRPDPYAGDFIASLLASRTGPGLVRSELLLRLLLRGLLDQGRAEPPLARRVTENQEALQLLLDALPSLRDPQLVDALISLLPRAPVFPAAGSLMTAGQRVLDALNRGGGLLDATEKALAIDLLGAIRQIGGVDFLDFCASVVHVSRDGELLTAARATAAVIASRGTR